MPKFFGSRLDLYQPDLGYKISMDSILLAACVHKGITVLDVGCGVGAAGLCLKSRKPEIQLTGIDIQKDNINFARKNSEINKLDSVLIEGDINHFRFPKTFDHVMSNPPFYQRGQGQLSEHAHKNYSNILMNISLEGWLIFCMNASHEWMTIIHLPENLTLIFKILMEKKWGGVKVFPIWIKGKASRIIVQANKKSKAPIVLLKGLTLRDENGYTEETEDILRHAKGIFL